MNENFVNAEQHSLSETGVVDLIPVSLPEEEIVTDIPVGTVEITEGEEQVAPMTAQEYFNSLPPRMQKRMIERIKMIEAHVKEAERRERAKKVKKSKNKSSRAARRKNR